MASRRRRRKSIGKIVVDVEKRLRAAETRPGAKSLGNRVVTTNKIAYRTITTKQVSTNAITSNEAAFGVNYVSTTDPDAALIKAGTTVTNPDTGATKVYDYENDDFITVTDTAAQYDATAALTSAGNRNRIFYQTTSPANPTGGYDLVEGDTWFDIDNDYKLSKWTGSAWTDSPLGDAAIDNLSVSKLLAGNIAAGQYIQAGVNNTSARIILAPSSGSSGGYSWDAGLSIYANATYKTFYADMSGNVTITGGTIQTTSTSGVNKIIMDSSKFKVERNAGIGDQSEGTLVEFDTTYGTVQFLNSAIEHDLNYLSTGSGATLIESLSTTTYYRPLDYSDLTFITGSTNGYIRYRIERTGPSYSADPGSGQYNSDFYISPPEINGVPRNPGIVFANNLFEYGDQTSDGTGTGEGKAKHSVYIDDEVGTYFQLSGTDYAVKTLRNMYAVPSGTSTFSTSGSIKDGEVLLYYTP